MSKRKKPPSTALVRTPRTNASELALPRNFKPENNPAAVYLASLGKDSRASMASGLREIARTINAGAGLFTLPWPELRFKDTQAMPAVLI